MIMQVLFILFVLLQPSGTSPTTNISLFPTQNINVVENLYGSLTLNQISTTAHHSTSLTSRLAFDKYKVKRIDYNYIVVKVIFNEPLYLHRIGDKLERKNTHHTETNIIRLGNHPHGALNKLIKIQCDDIKFNKYFCGIKQFDESLTNHKYHNCMYDLTSSRKNNSIKWLI